MSPVKSELLKNSYRDSVFLMKVSSQLGNLEGIEAASAMMATERNRDLFRNAGLFTPELSQAKADDLAVVVRGADEAMLTEALAKARELLSSTTSGVGQQEKLQARRLEQVLTEDKTFNMVLISVAGDYAKYEAAKAIRQGLNVMLYSDNISLEDELLLKKAAARKGVLVMGPDCGTAIINGIPLAFANKVRSGRIGIVGASGTGIQEVSCLIHTLGSGVSHAIGTGGRDLKDQIGGITALTALNYLKQDSETDIIVLLSKPPGIKVREKLCSFIQNCPKPVVVIYIGCDDYSSEKRAGAITAHNLEDAACKAVNLSQDQEKEPIKISDKEAYAVLLEEALKKVKKGRYLRGIFGGGSLCYEAMHILRPLLGEEAMFSNITLSGIKSLPDVWQSQYHTFVDMGDDEFTVGKPHPMIDPTEKNKRMIQEIQNPDSAVILFDLVIGYGSHSDPAAEVVRIIERAKEAGEELGTCLIASVCGTEEDTPSRSDQIRKLHSAGVIVMPSNAHAAMLAGDLFKKLNTLAGR